MPAGVQRGAVVGALRGEREGPHPDHSHCFCPGPYEGSQARVSAWHCTCTNLSQTSLTASVPWPTSLSHAPVRQSHPLLCHLWPLCRLFPLLGMLSPQLCMSKFIHPLRPTCYPLHEVFPNSAGWETFLTLRSYHLLTVSCFPPQVQVQQDRLCASCI